MSIGPVQLRPWAYCIRGWWVRRFEQFAIASSVVLTLSVVAVGDWVAESYRRRRSAETSGAAALYMTNFVEPMYSRWTMTLAYSRKMPADSTR